MVLDLDGAIQKLLNIEYAKVGDISLKLDVYLPSEIKNPTLIVWIHGGAWEVVPKTTLQFFPWLERGMQLLVLTIA